MASGSKDTNLTQLAQRVFNDAIHNIIHDIVITKHREHKHLLATIDPVDRLPHCETCDLPKLLDPPLAAKVRGALTEPPSNTTYCDRKPWSQRPGHDIYDNPFPRSDVTGRAPSKKEREAAAKNKKDGEDASNEPGSPSADGSNDPPAKLEKGEKKANKIDEKLKKGEYVPWHTCPNCKRSLLITRFAKHLEQCMGLSGRAASRNAMAKMNGSTPSGSRNGTPAPNGPEAKDKDAAADEEDEDLDIKGPGGVRKKLLKKGLNEKMKKEKALAGVNGKLKRVGSSTGTSKKASSPAPSASDGKRDRDEMSPDEDGEEVHVKKRQKMSRVDSQASFSSTVNGATEMDRRESLDGSFVDDGTVDD